MNELQIRFRKKKTKLELSEMEPLKSSFTSRVLCGFVVISRICSKNKSLLFLNTKQAISGKTPPPFPACDWRFNEFPNPVAHALHATWVELMALPATGPEVGDALFDVIFKGSYVTHDTDIRTNIVEWINAVGLVLSSLPVNHDYLYIFFSIGHPSTVLSTRTV